MIILAAFNVSYSLKSLSLSSAKREDVEADSDQRKPSIVYRPWLPTSRVILLNFLTKNGSAGISIFGSCSNN